MSSVWSAMTRPGPLVRSSQSRTGETCQPHASLMAALTPASTVETPGVSAPKRPPVASSSWSGVMSGGSDPSSVAAIE